MAEHDVIVIGASSGGVEPLTRIVEPLSEDLPAALFVVLHVRADAPSQLPAILNRVGRLPAAHAVDGERIRRGRIYVAPPGLQTYLEPGRIRVRRGPRENSHRPAIDPLFRTAAHHYGPRVIGVVLSGALDDGSAGLLAVKTAGGVAIVQDPDDAVVADMPANALSTVEVDARVPADRIADLLKTLVSVPAMPGRLAAEVPLETVEETGTISAATRSDELGPPSHFTCPECEGTLYEISDGAAVRFRCRVGHAYSEDAMLSAQGESVERALWTALRALEERSALLRKLAKSAERRGQRAIALMFRNRGEQVEDDVKAIHDVITTGRSLEPVTEDDAE